MISVGVESTISIVSQIYVSQDNTLMYVHTLFYAFANYTLHAQHFLNFDNLNILYFARHACVHASPFLPKGRNTYPFLH